MTETTSTSSFQSETRVSSKLAIALLAASGLAFLFFGEAQSDPVLQLRALSLEALFYVAAASAWRLETWRPLAGRWFAILALVVLVLVTNSWIAFPGLLTLLVVPAALAVPLISLPAAIGVAIGETMLLLVLPSVAFAGANPAARGVAGLVIWMVLGVTTLVVRSVYQYGRWSSERLQRAQDLAAEARNRRGELEQTMAALASANRQLALANERMTALRTIAEEARRTKAAFVANVSHEFRTPLNMIIGLVDLMVDSPEIYSVVLTPEMVEDLQVVHRNCEHLSTMINDVLDMTRMEGGHLALHRERVDLREVIESSVAAVRPLLAKKNLTLKLAIPKEVPRVYCDRTRIKQVFLNLVSNAARITEEGGITIQVETRDKRALVSIVDSGPGIAREDAGRIFEPFCQADSGLWRDTGGTGLGLSISRQFVRLHGGQMWLESRLGVGTTFFFTLPISSPLEHTARPGHRIREDWVWREPSFRPDRASHAQHPVKPCIVVCDETGAIHPQLRRYSDEIEFIDVPSVTQIARVLRDRAARAVVLNVVEPGALWPLLETVKREAPNMPIVCCSVPPQARRAVDFGALGYLIKPIRRTTLEEAIRSAGKGVRRVLLVDDDPDVLRLFTRMLRVCDEGLEIVTASSGRQAVEQLRLAPPDLMLLDIVMPDMDGWQVLETARNDEQIGDVPTYFVSAQDPEARPPSSSFLLAAMDGGLSLNKLLHGCLEMSSLLLAPEQPLDPVPE